MSELFDNEKYAELIKALELRDIVTRKTFVERYISPSDFAQVKTLSLNLERGEIEPVYMPEQIIVPIAYKVTGQTEPPDTGDQTNVFHFEMILEVVFACSEMDKVQELLSSQTVKGMFLGYQMDKFAWPYLRCAFANACSSLGKRSFVLPMLS